jgi:hypothetical protein
MTDRYNTLTVVLDHDIRDDDAEPLVAAIEQMRGVLSVKGNVTSISDHMAEERALRRWRTKIHELFWPPTDSSNR